MILEIYHLSLERQEIKFTCISHPVLQSDSTDQRLMDLSLFYLNSHKVSISYLSTYTLLTKLHRRPRP
jgi:hypothetical protein